MKKIFGKIDTRREEKENEKAHSSFIGKKYSVGKHTVVVEVKQKNILLCCNDQENLFAIVILQKYFLLMATNAIMNILTRMSLAIFLCWIKIYEL